MLRDLSFTIFREVPYSESTEEQIVIDNKEPFSDKGIARNNSHLYIKLSSWQ